LLPGWVLAALVWAISSPYTKRLPPPPAIDERLQIEPVQTSTEMPHFRFVWKGTPYIVEPKANYHLRGLIVSHNNPSGWGDIYHDDKSVDLRDLCVVWGETLANGSYLDASYWSEPWTCNVRTKKYGNDFSPSELSNNHILAGSDQVAATIQSAWIGDQIELKGFLVDYYPESQPNYVRPTSLVRTDTGNGACEVFFATEARFLATANQGWRITYVTARSVALLGILLWLGSFFVLPYLEYRAMLPDEALDENSTRPISKRAAVRRGLSKQRR
jgi:hypothetical protein